MLCPRPGRSAELPARRREDREVCEAQRSDPGHAQMQRAEAVCDHVSRDPDAPRVPPVLKYVCAILSQRGRDGGRLESPRRERLLHRVEDGEEEDRVADRVHRQHLLRRRQPAAAREGALKDMVNEPVLEAALVGEAKGGEQGDALAIDRRGAVPFHCCLHHDVRCAGLDRRHHERRGERLCRHRAVETGEHGRLAARGEAYGPPRSGRS
mmetsp:Transcript_24850/g.66724  ORF Transcript_24850/g.66724 Transcript_24850/m.66724 type:complete len:210 (-) Transcript_24850:49-678(-)